MREFYYNINILEDGSISTRVSNHSLKLEDDLLRNIIGVPRGRIKSVAGKTCSVDFLKECSKIPNARRAGFRKKIMKGE